ncbi:MAG: DinB family protein, partial [Ginsengibacter sp.]
WEKPAGVASPAFHLQHVRGVIDRLFTYARKEQLNEEQMYSLSVEGNPQKSTSSLRELTEQLDQQINHAIKELMDVKEDTLTEARGVGRKQIPTTLIGLYVHAAEHSMRHIGQLLVTVRIVNDTNQNA